MLSALFGLEAEGIEAALLSYPIAVERKTVFNLSPWHVHVFSVLDILALGLHQTFLHGAGVELGALVIFWLSSELSTDGKSQLIAILGELSVKILSSSLCKIQNKAHRSSNRNIVNACQTGKNRKG